MYATPPKMVYDDRGQLIEVILSAKDYFRYLRTLTEGDDWENLPPYIQDAVDQFLIAEVRSEKETAVSLESVLAE